MILFQKFSKILAGIFQSEHFFDSLRRRNPLLVVFTTWLKKMPLNIFFIDEKNFFRSLINAMTYDLVGCVSFLSWVEIKTYCTRLTIPLSSGSKKNFFFTKIEKLMNIIFSSPIIAIPRTLLPLMMLASPWNKKKKMLICINSVCAAWVNIVTRRISSAKRSNVFLRSVISKKLYKNHVLFFTLERQMDYAPKE